MRVYKTVSTVLVTTFAGAVALGGLTAGTAFAADQPRPQVAQEAPLPEAQQLQQQAQALGETSDMLRPVAELLDAVLNAPEGRLSPEEADRHAKAIQEALAPLQAQQGQQAADNATARAADTLEAQVDQLLMAAEAGDQQGITHEGQATVRAAVNLMNTVVEDGRLPAAEQQNAPQAENAPQAQDQQQGPQLPESQLPPGDPKLELLSH